MGRGGSRRAVPCGGGNGGDCGVSRADERTQVFPSPQGGEGGAKRRVRALRPPTAIPRARNLRAKMTDAERRFWNLVRNRNFSDLKFVRQYPVGSYIADF